MTFAEDLTKLIDWAKTEGITMKEIAESSNIPYRSIQDWKLGKHEPDSYKQGKVYDDVQNAIETMIARRTEQRYINEMMKSASDFDAYEDMCDFYH